MTELKLARALSRGALSFSELRGAAGLPGPAALRALLEMGAAGLVAGGLDAARLTAVGRRWLELEEQHAERKRWGWSEAFSSFLAAGFSQADAREMADQRADYNRRRGA